MQRRTSCRTLHQNGDGNAARNVQVRSRDEPRFTTAMKKHNHSRDDRPIQYRGQYSRHSRGQATDHFRVRSQHGCHMSEAVKNNTRSAGASAVAPRLFVLEINAGRIHSMNADGSDKKTIVSDCHLPDGIVVDAEAGHIYWTNMGIPNLDDGSIERADLDGKNRRVIVTQGVTHTPKQIHLDKDGGKLYWCDREGMRVMRANLDGSQAETLVETGRGDTDGRDQTRWCVGITIDPQLGKIYWTQKGPTKGGLGRLCRANIDIPSGESPANRS